MKSKILIALTVLLSGCGGNMHDIDEEIAYHIVKYDSIVISVPDSIPFIDAARSWSCKDSTISYLIVGEQGLSYEMYLYNLSNENWGHMEFNKEGPQGLSSGGNYDFFDQNKIVYFPFFTDKVLIINRLNDSIENIYYYEDNIAIPNINGFSSYIDEHIIVFPAIINNMRISKSFFQTSKIFALLSVVNNHFEHIVEYPNNFLENHKASAYYIAPQYCINGDSIIFSFKKDHKIYAYDIKTNSDTSYTIKKEYLPEFINSEAHNDDYILALKREFGGEYKLLAYDKYSNVYYRVSVYYEDYKGKIPKSQEEFDRLFSSRIVNIIALDSKFNVIANENIKGVTDAQYFVDQNGLYMRSLHEKGKYYCFH